MAYAHLKEYYNQEGDRQIYAQANPKKQMKLKL